MTGGADANYVAAAESMKFTVYVVDFVIPIRNRVALPWDPFCVAISAGTMGSSAVLLLSMSYRLCGGGQRDIWHLQSSEVVC